MRRALLLLLLLWPVPVCRAEKPAEQWLLVTAPAFRTALEPLCEHRKAEGMRVVVVPTNDVLTDKEIRAGDARKLADRVTQLCRDFKGDSYVLLVGAVDANKLEDPEKKLLPPLKGTVSRMKGQPSDHGYGSPDQDMIPTVAVGRFPARTEAEVKQFVQKVIAFETDKRPGEWRRRVTILAGVPAFNPVADKLVETLAMGRLEKIDPVWSGRAIYHNPSSRFTLPDDDLNGRALEYVQGGQALTLYLGHSNAEGLWAGGARYLDRDDWAKLKIARGPGVFATFGCLGCQLSGKDGEGYGVAAIRNANGPVAVIGSHGICFAAMVQLAADGLFQSFLAEKIPSRLGPVWLAIEKGVAKGPQTGLTFRLLDAVDGDSTIPAATQRREHLEMFLLLGDPALRLPAPPAEVKLRVSGEAKAGNTLTLSGELSRQLEGARVRVSLERPLTSEPADLQPLPEKSKEEQAKIMRANHERANRFALVRREAVVKDGRFEVRLVLPKELPWPRLTIRAYAATERQDGLGVLVVPVKE